jgi:hypothetical protein
MSGTVGAVEPLVDKVGGCSTRLILEHPAGVNGFTPSGVR